MLKYISFRRGRIVGLVRSPGKTVWVKAHRGFESLLLRQVFILEGDG